MLAGAFRQQRIFLNTIRFLANDLRMPLVCVGTDPARQALLTDPQLSERFQAFHLSRWSSKGPEGQSISNSCWLHSQPYCRFGSRQFCHRRLLRKRSFR